MTIRFAAARARTKSPTGAWRCRSVALCAANDNTRDFREQTVLVAALRHFARHGLGAATSARAHVLEANRAGDAEGALSWIAVCRLFDRRMAETLSAHLDAVG